MTVAIIALALALAGVVGGFVGVGFWFIKRDDAKNEELMHVRERVLKSENARTLAETALKELRDLHQSDRLRFQQLLAEREQEFTAFRDKAIAQAKSPELKSILTGMLTRKEST